MTAIQREARPALVSLVFLLFALGFSQARAQSIADLGAEEVSVSRIGSKAGESAWASVSFSREATGLVVSGRSSDRSLSGWGRFGEGPWRELVIVFSATDDVFYAGFHGDAVHRGGHFEVRFATTAQVSLSAAGVFDNRDDAGEAPAGSDGDGGGADRTRGRVERGDDPGDGAGGGALKTAGRVVAPRMYDRDEWGADPFRGDPVPLARPKYLYMAFHHAAGFGAYSLEDGLDQVKAIQDLHQNVRGWSDIGYQFVMDQSGRLYQGRPFLEGDVPLATAPELALGAHVGGSNTGNIGICVLGCYHPPYTSTCTDELSAPALDSLAVIFAFMAENYGVSPNNLRGHRQFETASTACPGDNNMEIIEQLRERVRTYLVTGNAPLGAAVVDLEVDSEGIVHLSWQFVEDNGIVAYRVERVQDGTATVIFEGEGAESRSIADGGAAGSGPLSYRLYAVAADGREQLLAEIAADLEDPRQYVLTENFPDPFSRSTTIRYYLPQDGIVRLAVYDVLGREVALLDEGSRTGGRWYHADLDADGLPAGTYFYRLEVEGFSGVEFNEARSIVRIR